VHVSFAVVLVLARVVVVVINVTLFVVTFLPFFVDVFVIVAAVVAVVFRLFLFLVLSLLWFFCCCCFVVGCSATLQIVECSERKAEAFQTSCTTFHPEVYISLRLSHGTNLPEYRDEIGVIFIRFTAV